MVEFMVDGSDSVWERSMVNPWWRSSACAGSRIGPIPNWPAHTWSCQFSPILEISSTKMSGIICWIRIIYYSKLLRSKMVRALRSISCFAHKLSMSMIQRDVLKPWRVTATILRRGCVTGYPVGSGSMLTTMHSIYLEGGFKAFWRGGTSSTRLGSVLLAVLSAVNWKGYNRASVVFGMWFSSLWGSYFQWMQNAIPC